MQWLDERGLRELSLQNSIDRVHDLIVGGMEQRLDDLDAELKLKIEPPKQRRKSKHYNPLDDMESYLRYSNVWA